MGRIVAGIALMLISATASAQQQKAASNVELVIGGWGSTTSKADFVSILVPISSSAATPSEARIANVAKFASFKAAMMSAGVGQSALTVLQPRDFGFVGNERYGIWRRSHALAGGEPIPVFLERPNAVQGQD